MISNKLSTDREHYNIPIVQGLLKSFGSIILTDDESTPLFTRDMRNKLRKLLELYFGTIAKRIQRDHNVRHTS